MTLPIYDPGASPIVSFDGPHRWLSNFGAGLVQVDGHHYRTREHAYQAGKATTESQRAHIAAAPTPGEAKRRGGAPPGWHGTGGNTSPRISRMWLVLSAYFAPGSVAANDLHETGTRILVEGNTWNDRFWGVDAYTHQGENWLGRMLMERRRVLFPTLAASAERVLCAALYIDDQQEHPHPPRNIQTGFVVAGHRHHNCLATAAVLLGRPVHDGVQGFITTNNRMVSRAEARALAIISGQVPLLTPPTHQLYSEDLY